MTSISLDPDLILKKAQTFFCDGYFDESVKEILMYKARTGKTNPDLDTALFNSLLRGNYMDHWTFLGLRFLQFLHTIDHDKILFAKYLKLSAHLCLQTSTSILMELDELNRKQPDYSYLYADILNQIQVDYKKAPFKLLVLPMTWSLAFGDMIVIHQFIKKKKVENPNLKILMISPLNRADLQWLAALNQESIDYLIDITLLPEEQNREKTIYIKKDDFLNLSHQEYVVTRILKELASIPYRIEKWRYFPILNEFPYQSGWRIWEKRAELFMKNKIELPKLMNQLYPKKNKICLHIRQANYDNDKRDLSPAEAQDLVNIIHQHYPDTELVRLGDASMTRLENCRNASHENLTLTNQIREIQESCILIGSHSAPQHLAVACSETPVICLNYVYNDTCHIDPASQIARVSLEPVGKQVKSVCYVRLFDADDKPLMPHLAQSFSRIEHTTPQEFLPILQEVFSK